MKKRKHKFMLIITVALKKEVPKEWFLSHAIPVHTLAALKSGILNHLDMFERGMMMVITGAGLQESEEAAVWIRDNLNPLFVLNIGTCGLLQREYPLGEWIQPVSVSNEDGDTLLLDTRLPIPFQREMVNPHYPPFSKEGDDNEKERDGNPCVSHPGKGGIKESVSLLSVAEARQGGIPDRLKSFDAVDMECYTQAKVLDDTEISFHCLKFGTDYADDDTVERFNRNIEIFTERVKELFRFVEKKTGNPPHSPRNESIRTFTEVRAEKSNNPPYPPFIKRGGLESHLGLDITVIIPVYNREQTIERAVDSVLAQTYQPDEIIVVDDGSTDSTGEILKSYGDTITLISLPENSGPSRARNEGLKQATTAWVAFLDSDDLWERDKLQNQVEYLYTYPFYEIMQSEEVWIRNGKRVNPCRYHKKPEGWIWERSLERCLISPSGVLAKKSLLQKYGNFDETFPVCEDYDLWLKISRHHPAGLEPSSSVIKYGGHDDQLSRRFPAMDRYRVKTLLRSLQEELLPEFREKIIPVLKKKLEILIQGYEKRGKVEDAEECRGILESLENDNKKLILPRMNTDGRGYSSKNL